MATAGELAVSAVPRAEPRSRAGDVREALAAASFEYAVDVAVCDGERLVGLVPIKQVLAADPGIVLGELVDQTTVVAAGADREQVASQVTKRMGRSAAGAPMTVVQVLVINLLTDGLPAVALARDPALPGHERVARSRTGALLSGRLWAALAVVGVLVGLAAFAAFTIGKAVDGDTGRTMAFLTVGLAELGFVFSCRSVLRPAWRVPWNPYLVGGVAASLVLLLLAVYLPVHGAFGTVPLGAVELIVALGLALLPVTAVEVVKAVVRRSSARSDA